MLIAAGLLYAEKETPTRLALLATMLYLTALIALAWTCGAMFVGG